MDYLNIIKNDLRSSNFDSLSQLASLLISNESTIFSSFIELRLNDLILLQTSKTTSIQTIQFYAALFEGLKLLPNLYYLLTSWNKILGTLLEKDQFVNEDRLHHLLSLCKTVVGRVDTDTVILLIDGACIPTVDFAVNHLYALKLNYLGITRSRLPRILLARSASALLFVRYISNVLVNHDKVLTILAPIYFPLVLQITLNSLSCGISEEFIDSLFSLNDFLSCLSSQWQGKLTEYLVDNFISPVILCGEAISGFVMIHLFKNSTATTILHRIIVRLFHIETSPDPARPAVNRISIAPLLQTISAPSEMRLLSLSLLYSIFSSKISGMKIFFLTFRGRAKAIGSIPEENGKVQESSFISDKRCRSASICNI
jgi:hypothetical protein